MFFQRGNFSGPAVSQRVSLHLSAGRHISANGYPLDNSGFVAAFICLAAVVILEPPSLVFLETGTAFPCTLPKSPMGTVD
jgi:hypothetical protein